MGFYDEQVLPRVIDKMLGNDQMAKVRLPTVTRLHGTVLELGFGSGPNVPLYPDAVDRVLAVDPSIVGRRLAAGRIAVSDIPVEFVGLDGEHLPVEDASVDCVLSTWTLCTIPHVEVALAEAGRVLKPGGELVYLEHGLSPEPRVAKRQHLLNPLQNKVAGGCNLDRDIEALVRAAGFEIDHAKQFAIAGPKTMSWMYTGVARRADGAGGHGA